MRVKTYREFLDGDEPDKNTERIYLAYLHRIGGDIITLKTSERRPLRRSELKALDDISNYIGALAEENKNA